MDAEEWIVNLSKLRKIVFKNNNLCEELGGTEGGGRGRERGRD